MEAVEFDDDIVVFGIDATVGDVEGEVFTVPFDVEEVGEMEFDTLGVVVALDYDVEGEVVVAEMEIDN